MIAWVVTGILALLVMRIVWIEVKCGRRTHDALSKTDAEINIIKQSATESYRAKFGKDPTGVFHTVSSHATKKT